MPTPNDIDLMQHADGELDDRDFEQGIESDPVAHAKLEGLGEINELVRGRLELAADDVSDRKFAAMWRSIDRTLDSSSEVPARAAPARESVSVWRRIGGWFEHYRGHLVTGMVSAGAVAALALILRSGDGDVPDDPTKIGAPIVPVKFRTPPQVESLDTPDGTGTVLNLEDDDGNTTVIWVTPADTVEGI
jgi:hypothetical protein